MEFFRSFARCDKGVTLVEYGIALVLVITIGTVSLTALGTEINDNINEAAAAL